MVFAAVFLVLTAIVILYAISVYNRFQTLKNGAEATLGQVKVALKKRLDLISQLLESVKSYAKFEKDTLTKITEMRSSVLKSESPKEISNLDKETKQILGNILVAVENYPELKTSNLVKELMNSVQSVEDEIARFRYTYNNTVQEYNTMLDTFPSNLIGKNFGFKKMEYLEFEEEIEKRPNLNWNL